jgi:hypothetical protein
MLAVVSATAGDQNTAYRFRPARPDSPAPAAQAAGTAATRSRAELGQGDAASPAQFRAATYPTGTKELFR